jgi:hypothetical protein
MSIMNTSTAAWSCTRHDRAYNIIDNFFEADDSAGLHSFIRTTDRTYVPFLRTLLEDAYRSNAFNCLSVLCSWSGSDIDRVCSYCKRWDTALAYVIYIRDPIAVEIMIRSGLQITQRDLVKPEERLYAFNQGLWRFEGHRRTLRGDEPDYCTAAEAPTYLKPHDFFDQSDAEDIAEIVALLKKAIYDQKRRRAQSNVGEWRPWKARAYTPPVQAAMRTLALLAKAPGAPRARA